MGNGHTAIDAVIVLALGSECDGAYPGLLVVALLVVQVEHGIITRQPGLLTLSLDQGMAQVIVADFLHVVDALLAAHRVHRHEQQQGLGQGGNGLQQLPQGQLVGAGGNACRTAVELVTQFQAAQHEHLSLMLVELALQVKCVAVLGDGDSLVKVAVPVALEMESRLELVVEFIGIDAVVIE